jgi:hypothetical protein
MGQKMPEGDSPSPDGEAVRTDAFKALLEQVR